MKRETTGCLFSLVAQVLTLCQRLILRIEGNLKAVAAAVASGYVCQSVGIKSNTCGM